MSVHFWFKGPQAQGNATQLARIESDLGEAVGVELAPA